MELFPLYPKLKSKTTQTICLEKEEPVRVIVQGMEEAKQNENRKENKNKIHSIDTAIQSRGDQGINPRTTNIISDGWLYSMCVASYTVPICGPKSDTSMASIYWESMLWRLVWGMP